MPRKESNVAVKHIPTKSEVKESTNKMIKAIAFSDKEPLKVALEVERDTKNTVVQSTVFSKKKIGAIAPSGEAKVFERIVVFKDDSNSLQ